jgi:hypothetical protein
MAFQSDYKAKRTWDPDSGWELFDVTRGPGHPAYELRHPNSQTLSFWCKRLALERVEGETHLGHPRYARKEHVNVMSVKPPSGAERQMIHDALNAYGSLHNGPLGPLELSWDESRSPRSHLVTAVLCAKSGLASEIASAVHEQHSDLTPEALEFLTKVANQAIDVLDQGFQVVLERDCLTADDVRQFVEVLRPFWLALFSSMESNPYSGPNRGVGVTPLVGRAADAFRALAADNILILLEDDRLDDQFSWRVNPAPGGRLVIDAYEF